jgi:hypothetical protein
MVPHVVLALIQSLPGFSYGSLVGCNGLEHLVDRRWCVEAVPGGSAYEYEWELQSRSSQDVTPYELQIFLKNGVKIVRNARCPRILSNYIALDSPNLEGVDEIFRDNTLYFLNNHTCVMQNPWFTLGCETSFYGKYFTDKYLPCMSSVLKKSK